jgi:hypothetical protein
MRVLVTGSRKWDNRDVIEGTLGWVLDEHGDRPIVLVHGGADGADTIAAQVWEALGQPTEPHPANWRRYGKKRAGIIRNAQMVAAGADLCLAFIRNHSPGATDCADRAQAAGIPLRIHREDT